MAEIITCPVCGENNPGGQEFCQYCQSRLQPLTGSLKGADAPLKPGQAPTKKNTAELEPILPQWLKDARSSARSNEQPESPQLPQRPPVPAKTSSSDEDLLAGLRSQSADNEEDETPDWLASITGATPKPKKPATESSEVRWVELGDKKDFAQEESTDDSETPSWLAGLTPTEPQADEKDELTDWFRNVDETNPAQQADTLPSFDSSFPSASSVDDTPDWLRQMAADEESKKEQTTAFDELSGVFPPETSETPDWLSQLGRGEEAVPSQPNSFDIPSNAIPSEETDTPDWLRQMAATENIKAPSPSDDIFKDAPEFSIDVPDWLRGMEDKAQGADSVVFAESGSGEKEAPTLPSTGELPAWLNTPAEPAKPNQDTTPKWLKNQSEAATTGELPAWLSSSEDTVRLPAATEEEPSGNEIPQDDALGDLPTWLKAAAPHSSIYESPIEQPPVEVPAEDSSDTPDWLSAFKPEEELEAKPAFEKETPFDLPPAIDVSAQDSGASDDLFKEMPDWLSNALDLPPSTSPTPITNTDAISPGELPSWVQAMRPVDEAAPTFSSLFSNDKSLESRGALAGLQGVLPSVPGFTPTSKPKPYSIRLQASEEQQAHAALLEQILAAETAPVPIASYSAMRASRGLRWFLTFVIFAAVISGLLMRNAPIFSMPLGVPREVGGALDVSRSIPEGAPVLVAFDYEASRTGEMEVAAAPFFDQMILLKHPRLTFISTDETGSILAERFISGPLSGHNYENGITYLNLGYLPGGQLGIRAFAQNPSFVSPLDMSLQPAWTSAPLEGVTSFSQFAALVLITDSADAARTWIEQTESARGNIPFVVISSAQAAPMIQPYYDSQQVKGVVSGLYGGAVFEQNNAGRPGTARSYWDAYSVGMLLAMSLVLGGGLWNLASGLRDRVLAREAK
jgi:hypothetical protein